MAQMHLTTPCASQLQQHAPASLLLTRGGGASRRHGRTLEKDPARLPLLRRHAPALALPSPAASQRHQVRRVVPAASASSSSSSPAPDNKPPAARWPPREIRGWLRVVLSVISIALMSWLVVTLTGVLGATTPVLQSATPVLEAATPTLQTAQSVLQDARPVLHAATPVLQATTTVLQDVHPVLEATTPVLEAALPTMEAAQDVMMETTVVLKGVQRLGVHVIAQGVALSVAMATMGFAPGFAITSPVAFVSVKVLFKIFSR